MTGKIDQVTIGKLIEIARQLGPDAAGFPADDSPDANPEYYRAITELLSDAAGLADDERGAMRSALAASTTPAPATELDRAIATLMATDDYRAIDWGDTWADLIYVHNDPPHPVIRIEIR